MPNIQESIKLQSETVGIHGIHIQFKGNTKGDLEIIIQTRQLQYDDSKTHATQITQIAIVHRIRLRSLKTIFLADVLQRCIGLI